ncbi:hypothetical protein [Desulfococcus sp.]|uniref:hypothetical protein n=1 Tax=Desulfococcus sp. TaxID=2025834 RepID=UPI003593C1F7
MKFTQSFSCLLSLCLLSGLVILSSSTSAGAAADLPDLVILYTGDGRGNIEPSGCCSKIGGMARRATKIKEFRELYKNVILADSGDFLWKRNGDMLHPLQVEHVRKAFTAIGYDAVNIGDGEITSGETFIKHFRTDSAMPLVSSNVTLAKDAERAWHPYIIRESGKVKTAIIGLSSPDLVQSNPDGLFAVSDPIGTLEKLLPEISAKADIIVLLSHLGWEKSKQVVERFPMIDIVVVGHDSYPTFSSETIGKTLMVKNAAGGGLLGVVEIWTGASNLPVKMESRLEVLVEKIQPLPEYAKLEQDYRGRVFAYKRRPQPDQTSRDDGKYLKMTPEQFMEEMKKENRVLSMDEFMKKNKIKGFPQAGKP